MRPWFIYSSPFKLDLFTPAEKKIERNEEMTNHAECTRGKLNNFTCFSFEKKTEQTQTQENKMQRFTTNHY